jgi:hypothetical protein
LPSDRPATSRRRAADGEPVRSIHEVANGRRYVDPSLGSRHAGARADAPGRARATLLPESEHDGCHHSGTRSHEIAEFLFNSIRTAES